MIWYISVYNTLEGTLDVKIAVGYYVIYQRRRSIGSSSGTIWKWHKRVSMQHINKTCHLIMCIITQEIIISCSFPMVSTSQLQIAQNCSWRSVFDTNYDIYILVKWIYIYIYVSKTRLHIHMADSRFAPSQWETALLCNDISHWLGANLKSALDIYACWHALLQTVYKNKYQWTLENV